jgi:hypothetical protein
VTRARQAATLVVLVLLAAACSSDSTQLTVGNSGAPESGSGESSGEQSTTPGDPTRTITVHQVDHGTNPNAVHDGYVTCPPDIPPGTGVALLFDKENAPDPPGSNVVATAAPVCHISQVYFDTPHWLFTTECGPPPPGWRCELDPTFGTRGVVPGATVYVGDSPGNIDVTFVNTYT